MLICPQCQFENSDANKFCQQCGITLTEKVCPACDSRVSFQANQCHNCGTIVGPTWSAILSGKVSKSLYEACQQSAAANATASPAPAIYLDPDQRYRILTIPSAEQLLQPELRLTVLDCQPFQLAPAIAEPDTIDATSEQSLIYLALQDSHYPTLPGIHTAWIAEEQAIILLEDRTNWPLLRDALRDPQISFLQALHWFHEAIRLWSVLEPWQQLTSLLHPENLRLDEDQVLCLQRLYSDRDSTGHPPTNPLQSLGILWDQWLQPHMQTSQSPFRVLGSLLQELIQGKIDHPQTIQTRIEDIYATALAPEIDSIHEDIKDSKSSMESTASLSTSPMSISQPESSQSESAKLPEQLTTESSPQSTVDQPLVSAEPALSENSDLTAPDISVGLLGGAMRDMDDSDQGDPTIVLPMRLVSLEDAGRTDIGRQRDHNEDCFSIQTKLEKVETPQGRTVHARGLYILCDGMGGHAGGEVASALAVETLRKHFQTEWFNKPMPTEGGLKFGGEDVLPDEASIREAIRSANSAIYEVNQKNSRSGSGRMGTTLVIVLIQDTAVAVAHVGDSRMYTYSRKRGLEQITTDHEVGQQEIFRGVDPEIAYARPDAYQLTQALGPRDNNFVNPDVKFMELNEDTVLLLCSDGLSDNDLLETNWRTHVEPLVSSRTNLEQGVSQLIDLANDYNGHDNITAIAIRTKVRPNLEQLRYH